MISMRRGTGGRAHRVAVIGVLGTFLATAWFVHVPPHAAAGTAFDCQGETYATLAGPDAIANGGFEGGFTGWAWGYSPVTVSTAFAHSGNNSAKVDAVTTSSTFAYEALASPSGTFVFVHWLYIDVVGPGGQWAAAIVRGWNPSSGGGTTVAAAIVHTGSIQWYSWLVGGVSGLDQTVPYTVTRGAWHSFAILGDASRGVECLYVDGALLSTASIDPALTFLPDTVVFGDTSWAGDAGIAYYDGLSLTAAEAAQGPVTTLSIGAPNYTASNTWVTSSTPLTLTAVPRNGTTINVTMYRIDGGPWTDYATTGPFRLAGEGSHLVEWYSEDNASAVEPTRQRSLVVDDTPPATTMTLGSPSYGTDFVTSSTVITLAAVDGGATPSGVRGVQYRIDAAGWSPYQPPPARITLVGEGAHSLEYRAVDRLGNLEAVRSATLNVDDSAPMATVIPGSPNCTIPGSGTWVRSTTPLTISAWDLGPVPVGVSAVEYRVWNGTWGQWSPYATPFTVAPEGRRFVEWRTSDLLGNLRGGNASFIVDDTPPTSAIATTAPILSDNGVYVTSATRFSIVSADGGAVPVGLGIVEYSPDGTTWSAYSTAFTLTGADGPRAVHFRGTDRLGNVEPAKVLNVILDNTPPMTTITVPEGPLSVASRFRLSAVDSGSGVGTTEYRIDGGAWQPYLGPFALSIGDHVVGYRSTDRLGNVEPERTISTRIENWKPVVALVFAVVLVLLAAVLGWRARRKEWPRWRRILLAGVVCAVAEGVTGILSALLGVLPIPPFLDLGTVVDAALLVAGILTVIALFLRARPRPMPPVPPTMPAWTGQGFPPQPPP